MASHSTLLERLAGSVLLLAVALSTCARCQEPPKDSAASAFLAFADSQWQYDLACTGLTPALGGDLSDVKWQIVTHNGVVQNHTFLLGLWIPPDTIRLDTAYVHSKWVVRHELLHHLLQGPPAPLGPHPFNPFWFPCRVMPAQHALKELESER